MSEQELQDWWNNVAGPKISYKIADYAENKTDHLDVMSTIKGLIIEAWEDGWEQGRTELGMTRIPCYFIKAKRRRNETSSQ